MGRISAGNNLTIDVDDNHWRLLANTDGTERVLVEAATGRSLRYMPTFGARRRLPDTGTLPTIYIQRVVLGWSQKDESWHLGLVLEHDLALARGSRWCEVAHWPDPDHDLYLDIAREAGSALARATGRPFSVIPPGANSTSAAAPAAPAYGAMAPAPAVARPQPPAALPPLPVTLDLWQLSQTAPGQLEFRRSSVWTRRKAMRVLWYIFWLAVYLVLAVLTLQGRIALPRPEFLPWLGLASAVVLLLLTFNVLGQMFNRPNRIVVEASPPAVRGLRDRRERWRVDAAEIEAVYVSQVVGRKVKRDHRTIHYAELNLLLRDGKFRYLLDNGQNEEKVAAVDAEPPEEGVVPLTPDRVASTMQTAAAHIAQTLRMPALYDQRLK